MTLSGVIMIVWYALQPWLWLLALLLAALLLSYGFGRKNSGEPRKTLWLLAVIAGLIAMLVAPALSHSQLSYVATWPDKAVLALIGLGVACYATLLLAPWLKRKVI